jgi:hypothetical protein
MSTIPTQRSETPAKLSATGYHIIEDFFTPEQCEHYLRLVHDYRQQHEVPKVYRKEQERSLYYYVIDGEGIKQNLPEVKRLYETDVNQVVNRLSNQKLVPMDNQRVGVNINITPAGGEYRWHYDRNALTCILYLNTVPGGETEIYPKYRILLRSGKFTRLQQYLDQLLRFKLVRRLFGKKVLVRPKQGTMVVMQGDRCLHSVATVRGEEFRINIIMAYDVPGSTFRSEKNLDKYLYTQEETTSSDPNYT